MSFSLVTDKLFCFDWFSQYDNVNYLCCRQYYTLWFTTLLRMSKVLKDVKVVNSLLSALSLKEEKIIAIKENGLADANFILTNLMQQIFSQENNKVCLVIMHNTLGHYHNISKRLGYQFLKKIEDGYAITIEPLKMIDDALEEEVASINFFSSDKEAIVRELFLNINNKINELLKNETDGQVYLIIDDISHLLDLNIDVKYVVIFLNYCTNLASIDRVSVVINCHVANARDEIISNALGYVSDVNIEVSPLKTGISHDVTGVIKITRSEQNLEASAKENVFHYRAFDKEIKVFAPGESLFHLYK